MLNNRSAISLVVSALYLAFSSVAVADDDKDESGKGRGHKREFKEEYWDGNCKVERKLEKNGDYKEERKCKGGDRHGHRQGRQAVVVPAPVVAYPPWIVVQGQAPVYRPGYEPAPVHEVPSAASCNSDTAGRILGGIAGAAIGNQIGSGSGRAVATVGGAIAGVLIGGEIGRRIDANDQACIGQALEVAPAGRRVAWTGESSQQYAVVPGKVVRQSDGRYCRNYVAEVRTSAGWQKQPAVACRRADGVWVQAR